MLSAAEYWNEQVESGQLDSKDLWHDGSGHIPVTLTLEDLRVIEDALKRRFIAIKSGRFEVLHAVHTIRRTLQ